MKGKKKKSKKQNSSAVSEYLSQHQQSSESPLSREKSCLESLPLSGAGCEGLSGSMASEKMWQRMSEHGDGGLDQLQLPELEAYGKNSHSQEQLHNLWSSAQNVKSSKEVQHDNCRVLRRVRPFEGQGCM